LSKDLLIPIIPKAHDVIKPKFLALCNCLIEEWIVELLKVCPIDILARDNWSLALAHDYRGVEILMQLTPKSSFQVFCLLIFMHIVLVCISQCHGLFEVISPHFNRKPGQNLRTGELRASGILALFFLKLYLKSWRCARANFPSNSLSCWICPGRRRLSHARHHVGSLSRCMRWRLAAACRFLAGAMIRSKLPWRRARRGVLFHLKLWIMAMLLPSLPCRSICTVSSHSLDIGLSD
jgi:hypothetical protein